MNRYHEEECCEEEDYEFHKTTIRNDGFDNFYNVEEWFCINCGNLRTLETLIPEDTGK